MRELPKTTAYNKQPEPWDYGGYKPTPVSDAMRDEMLAAIQEQERMLRLAVETIVAVAWGGDDKEAGVGFWLADIRKRAGAE